MIDEETQKVQGWLEMERFVALLQSSVRTADLVMEKEAVGDIHFAVTELSVSVPVDLGVAASTEQPLVRLPTFEEVVRTGGSMARLTFSLRPVPVEGGERPVVDSVRTAEFKSRLTRLIAALEDEDYRDRLRAVKELHAMGAAAAPARTALERVAKSDRSRQVREAAAVVLRSIG